MTTQSFEASDATSVRSEATTGHNLVEPLDHEGVCARCVGNLNLVRRVLDRFDRELSDRLVEMTRSADADDLEPLRSAAHRLRGAAANVGAVELQERFTLLERLCEVGAEDRISAIVADLPSAQIRFRRAVRTKIDGGDQQTGHGRAGNDDRI